MKRIGEALSEWQPHATVSSADPVSLLGEAWPEIVGADVAQHSHPLKIERGTLIIVTSHSGWSQQLAFLTERIVSAARQRAQQAGIERVRFRVGNVPSRQTRSTPRRASQPAPVRVAPRATAPPRTVDEALEQFRTDVEAHWRAKSRAGWKHCQQCGVWIAPSAADRCSSCEQTRQGERDAAIARLLYETPWLTFEAVAQLVGGLQRSEYARIRKALLSRWWETLQRALRAGRLSRDGHERLIASSYVLLRSGVEPERLAPATVRNVLGDDLHDLIYDKKEHTK